MLEKIDLMGQYEVEKATSNNQSFFLNMYIEEEQTTRLSQYPYRYFSDPPKGKYLIIAYPTFGLDLLCTLPTSPLRYLLEQNEVTYAIGGNTFYSVASNGSYTSLGTLTTSSGFAKIVAITGASDTNNQLLIIDGTNGYTYNIYNNTFVQLTNTVYCQTITVNYGGYNYTAPTAVISDGTGTGVTTTVQISTNGINSTTVTSSGNGYISPVVTVSDSQGTGAILTANMTGGLLASITVLYDGINYSATPTVTITDSTGINAAATANVNNGAITSITVTNHGSGYTNPTITITDGTGSGAVAVGVLGGKITSLNIKDGGANYIAPLIVITDASGTGAVATCTIGNGSITGVTIINGGSSYTAPTITFTDATGVSATATVTTGQNSFFNTSTDITNLDDYVIALESSSIQFYISNLSDSTTYNALNFASKTRGPDKIQAIHAHKGELWLFGTKSIECWDDTGAEFFPFQRLSNVLIEIGCAAPRAVLTAADQLFFFGKNASGGYGFFMIQSYAASNMATKAIAFKLTQLAKNYTLADCICYSYAQSGVEFIDWTFPTANFTFTYNVSNDTWTTRASAVYNNGRFLGQCSCFCYQQSLIGDSQSGNIYTQDNGTYTENGTAITRQYVTPPIYKNGNRIYVHRALIDVQVNVGVGTFLLEMSTDSGITWQSIQTFTIPTNGATQLYTTSLGSAYEFIFRLTCTANVDFNLLGFQAEAEILN